MAPNWVQEPPSMISEIETRTPASYYSSDVFNSSRSAGTVSFGLDASDGSRRTRYSDQQLCEMAATAGAVDWDALERELVLDDARSRKGGRWKQKKTRNVGDGRANVSTREGDGCFAVAAVSSIPCSVAELRLVFQTRSFEEFESIMRCVYPGAFLDGDLVHTVKNRGDTSTRSSKTASSTGTEAFQDLYVKTMRFEKPSFLSSFEDWCFLESIHSVSTSNASRRSSQPETPSFSRTLVTLPLNSCVTRKRGKNAPRAKEGSSVVMNYTFREDPSGKFTRVIFHGEFVAGRRTQSSSSWKFVKTRLMRMAEHSSRYLLVVRRRRLGMQVMVNPSHVIGSNSHCVCCSRSFRLTKKRLCFLCGYLICDKCSLMQQREFYPRGWAKSRIEDVRLCVRCLVRVDHCNFSGVTEAYLRPPTVVPDPPSRVEKSEPQLSNLLEQSLANADRERKTSVMSVMKYLAEVERDSSRSRKKTDSSFVSVSSAGTSTDNHSEHTDKLKQMGFNGPLDDGTPLEMCDLGNADSRSYPIQVPDDPSKILPAPIGPNEQKRLETIEKQKLNDLGDVPELDIICSIATKELDCSVSMITLVDREELHVLASTADSFNNKSFPREQGFCSHAIMDNKPLLVPHVQADVRFSSMPAVQQMNANFYCGFPLVTADDTVIGTVCCVDQRPHQLTRSQYVTMRNLAQTASKVVQRAARKRAESSGSSN